MEINRFRGAFGFLSNFAPSPMTVDGVHYMTVEHAYQAAKATTDVDRELIHNAEGPSEARALGQVIKARPNWNEVKIDVRRDLLRRKFANPRLRRLLLDTGDLPLVEGNTWGDTFWGVCGGRGENWLGRLLMEVREEIRGETDG